MQHPTKENIKGEKGESGVMECDDELNTFFPPLPNPI